MLTRCPICTVWSMPGGFSSLSGRGGYEDLDAGRDVEANPPPRAVPKPQAPAPAPAPPSSQPPGGYQTSNPSS